MPKWSDLHFEKVARTNEQPAVPDTAEDDVTVTIYGDTFRDKIGLIRLCGNGSFTGRLANSFDCGDIVTPRGM
jgi:hypothetical protein